MVPFAATARTGVLAVSAVGSVVTVDTTALEVVSIRAALSLVPAATSRPPSGVNARLLTGAPTCTRPVMTLVAVEMMATEPSRFDTYARPPVSTTSVGEPPTPAMFFTTLVEIVIIETVLLAVLVTYAYLPSEVIAIDDGALPTLIAA